MRQQRRAIGYLELCTTNEQIPISKMKDLVESGELGEIKRQLDNYQLVQI